MFNAPLKMKTPFPYTAFDKFVLRTPLLSFQFYQKLTANHQVPDEFLQEAFNDHMIQEAIFLASPTLYFELKKWIDGELEQKKQQRVKLSLLKYLSRMSSRCTPFGLFAGCTLGQFSERTKLVLDKRHKHQRFTRPDMNYLVALSQDLAKKEHIKQQLVYFPNSSLYLVGEQLRYIEYFYVESRRQHHIVEIDNSIYLQKILNHASKGATLHELANKLIDDTVTLEEAYGFLDELLESQVLTSALEPSVSGPPFINQMLNVLQQLKDCEGEVEFLTEISKRFSILDRQLGNDSKQYLQLNTFLKEQQTSFELKYLFQTDLEVKTQTCELDKNYLTQIKKALVLFNKITPTSSENNLSRFREAFYERYEEREMPLCSVLDVETGIGYLQNTGSGDINPLVDNLLLPPTENILAERDLKLNKVYSALLNKLIAANKTNQMTITLVESDFGELPTNWDDMPDTLSAMVELVQEHDGIKIQISGCGGSSAANLLARFCHGESNITPFAKSIIAKEKQLEPDKILAEIVHLPEARVGNILMRPSFREYEIPYLAQSILPKENQLSLEDLFISARGKHLYLLSKKHNKEVLPRLTNAHNYSANSLPIYHFLSDLQTQNLRGSIGFNFGPLDALFDFFPRVEYDNLILQEAKWRVKKEEITALVRLKSNAKELRIAVQKLRKTRQLPQYVLLADGDNELLINLENSTSVLMLLETVKNRNEFVLKEFLHHQGGVVSSNGAYYTNQVVVSFFKGKKANQKKKAHGTT